MHSLEMFRNKCLKDIFTNRVIERKSRQFKVFYGNLLKSCLTLTKNKNTLHRIYLQSNNLGSPSSLFMKSMQKIQKNVQLSTKLLFWLIR